MRNLRARFVAFALASAPGAVFAQPPATVPADATPHAVSEYGGVVPGTAHTPPRVGQLRARGARTRGRHTAATEIISWPGFQSQDGGGSRFFVQTTGPVRTEVHPSAGRVEIVFHDTTVHLANSRRWLETQYFETPVVRARLERRRRDMVLVMELRAAVTPTLSTGPDPAGFTFTYIDFAAGHYLPEAPPPAPPPPPTRDESGRASVRPASPESQAQYPVESPPPRESAPPRESRPSHAMDDERPPPVQTH